MQYSKIISSELGKTVDSQNGKGSNEVKISR